MEYSREHLASQKTLKRYIDEKINPHVDEWEAAEIFPAHEVFKGLGDLGLLGLTKPEAYGGMGLDYSYSMLMAETLGYIDCGGVPMAIGVQTDMCTPALARFGSEELKREFLAPAIAGDMVGCIGVSEPAAGSDLQGVKSTAIQQPDGSYLLNGSKTFITNGWHADLVVVVAKTNPGAGAKGTSLLLVERGMPGFEKGKRLKKLGLKAQDTSELFFDNVRVPAENLLGGPAMEKRGFICLMEQLPWERLQIAIQAVAAAQAGAPSPAATS